MGPSRVRRILAIAFTTLLVVGCDDDPAAPRLGSITINPEPDSINATWQVTGPDGFASSGAGDLTLSDLTPGDYAVTWGAVAGWQTPDPVVVTQTLAANGTLVFEAAYVALDLGLPFPETADQLMANFQDLYETMDLEELGKLLHPDHITILQASTTNQFPDVGETLDIDEEWRIHERMFSQQDVVDPLGALVPGIQAIQFTTFARQGTWSLSSPDDPIPEVEMAVYDVVIRFDRGGLYSTLVVQGSIKFYVTHRDSTEGAQTRPYFQMLGQLDQTDDWYGLGASRKAEAGVPWGSVKALFR